MGQLPTRAGSYCVTTETKCTLVSRELGQRVEEMEGFSETPFYFYILFPRWILVAYCSESGGLEQGGSTPTHAAHLINSAIK